MKCISLSERSLLREKAIGCIRRAVRRSPHVSIRAGSWRLQIQLYMTLHISSARYDSQMKRLCVSLKFKQTHLQDWGNKNPHTTCGIVRNSAQVNVWCGLTHDRVIRPFLSGPIKPDCDQGVVPEHAGTVCAFQFSTWNSLATGRTSALLQPHRQELPFP